MTGRKKNPRREILSEISKIKQWAQRMVSVWSTVPSVRHFADERGGPSRWHATPRKRSDIPSSEYVENDPRRWADLVLYMNATQRKAIEIERFAREQVKALGERMCARCNYELAERAELCDRCWELKTTQAAS